MIVEKVKWYDKLIKINYCLVFFDRLINMKEEIIIIIKIYRIIIIINNIEIYIILSSFL